jgi:hypothetical protein
VRTLTAPAYNFLLELTREEVENLKSHFATSSWGQGRKALLTSTEQLDRKKRPIEFTGERALGLDQPAQYLYLSTVEYGAEELN